MRVGAVFVIFALFVTVCRGFNHDVSDAARWFLYGTCGCVEHVSSGQSVATCQVDAERPMPDTFSYLGSNNCVNGYVPVCGKVFTVCYCLCKLAPTTTAPSPSSNPGTVTTPAPPTTTRFCQLGTTFSKMRCSAGDPCATDTNCFDVCTANVENSIAACFCENTNSLPFGHVGEQCDAGQRCNSNGRCMNVCPTGDPNCVCPAGRRNTVDCYCENLSGNTITSCTAGQQCNSDGNCQDPDTILPQNPLSAIVPAVVSMAPPPSFSVRYGSTVVNAGDTLAATSARDMPSITFPTQQGLFYTIAMVDPDAPAVPSPGDQFFHWLAVNVIGNDVSTGQTLRDYGGPAPPPGSGRHRYVFLAYQQQQAIISTSLVGSVDCQLTLNPGVTQPGCFHTIAEFAIDHNLRDPIAGNYFFVNSL